MKFKSTIKLSWVFECEGAAPFEGAKFAEAQLKSILPPEIVIQVTSTQIKKEKTSVKVLGVFTPEDVFPYLTREADRKEYIVDGQSYMVRMNSDRYFVFKKEPKCASCGLEGTKFLLERHIENLQPHFNFYGVENGKNVLLTKDHYIPRSKKGVNHETNYHTCCEICNGLKGNTELTYGSLARLRKFHDENQHLPRKKLADAIQQMKDRLFQEEGKSVGVWPDFTA